LRIASPTEKGNGAPVSRAPNATIHSSPDRPPALNFAASRHGGKRSGIRASLADSCCASLAIQKKGDASQVAGERSVFWAHPASLHRVPASGGVRSSVTSRRRSTAARRDATSASVARTPPSVRMHHARTSSTASVAAELSRPTTLLLFSGSVMLLPSGGDDGGSREAAAAACGRFGRLPARR